MSPSRFVAEMLSLGLAVLGSGAGFGQNFPNKPIRIVTSAAGGGSDFTARLIVQGISGPLGQPVIVDNRAGVIPFEIAAKAPPDGYTLLVNGGGTWITPLLQKVPYDAVSDFSPISLIVREVAIVAVNPAVPAKSIKELIALAKSKPGVLNFASDAPGGIANLSGALLNSMAGVNIVNVPYKGNPAGVAALIGGEVQLMIVDAALLAPHVNSGKLRALAVTSATPTALFPDLPTVAASGLPGYEAVGRTGIWAPAKTPEVVINRLNQEIVRYLNLPEVKERYLNAGAEVVASSAEQFAATIKADIAIKSKLIKDAGIRIN